MVLELNWMWWPPLLLLLLMAYIIYMSQTRTHFTKQGIPMPNKWLPVLGTSLRIFKEGLHEGSKGNHEKCGKTYGGLNGRLPVLTTIDADILREVFIKDFASFPNRSSFDTADPLDNNMLGLVTDAAQWKFLRSTLSPAFSSLKLKRMMKTINACAAVFADHLAKESKDGKSLEMKEFAVYLSIDVIAGTLFGLQLNTRKDRDIPLVKNAMEVSETTAISDILLSMFLPFLRPLVCLFNGTLFRKKNKQFFTDITNQILDARKDCDTEDDVNFIQLMMNAHKDEGEGKHENSKGKRGLTRQEIVSQVLSFFAGNDTTATTVSCLAYNLACNPEQQNKLVEEIQQVMGDRQEVTDDDLHKMPYLEMCVNESLRLYPPITRSTRVPTRDVVLKGIHMPKGSMVIAPIYCMHHNAEIYPDPEAFIPERFSREEKSRRDPMHYMPFGAGPRNCIAQRLALLEVKVAIIHVLKTHRFVRGPDTEVPIKLVDTLGGLVKPKNGIWLKLEKHAE